MENQWSLFEYSSLQIHNGLLQFVIHVWSISLSMCVYLLKKVLTQISIPESMLVFGQILIRLEIGIPVTTILGFQCQASTRLRYQWFRNRLDDKPQIRTPIRPILVWNELWNCLTHFSCLSRPRSAFVELI